MYSQQNKRTREFTQHIPLPGDKRCSSRRRAGFGNATACAGFTIIEVITLVTVLVIILVAIVAAVRYTYRGQRFAFEQADATRSARSGIERAVRDMREASYADDGAYPIVSIAATSTTFYSDYDNDGKVERIRYFLDDTDFKRGITESAGDPPAYATATESVTLVSDNVRNTALGTPIFTYYDTDGALMSDYSAVGDVGFVVASLVVNLHPERAPEDYELRSSAALRNIK